MLRKNCILLKTAVLFSVLVAGALAATPDSSLKGKPARITTDSTWASATLTGTIVALDSSSLSLTRSGELPGDSVQVRLIPFEHITRLELKEGKRRHILGGALIGAAAGGGIMGLVAGLDSDAGEFSELVTLVVVLGAGGGAVVGGVIGSQVKSPGWKEVPMERLWGVSVQTHRAGAQLTFSIRW